MVMRADGDETRLSPGQQAALREPCRSKQAGHYCDSSFRVGYGKQFGWILNVECQEPLSHARGAVLTAEVVAVAGTRHTVELRTLYQ